MYIVPKLRPITIVALTLLALSSAGLPLGRSLNPTQETPPFTVNTLAIDRDNASEAAAAIDVDNDGRTDLVSGAMWYRNPGFTGRKFRDIGSWGKGPDSSGYQDDFADLPADVDGDGKTDLVSAEYARQEVCWYKNIGGDGTLWPRIVIAKPGNSETAALVPLLGKNSICLLPNVGQKIVFYELTRTKSAPGFAWIEHNVGSDGAGHGVGWGDVNKDNRVDIVTGRGWWEQAPKQGAPWIWHPSFTCNPGDCSIGMPVYDVDGDKDMDIVFGSGHNYGVYWLEQVSPDKWEQRTIDKTWSQAHAIHLARLPGFNEPVILTGKRYLAHDHDPGFDEPLCVVTYRYNRAKKTWLRATLSLGGKVGTGLHMTVATVPGLGDVILCPGKSGFFVLQLEK